MSYDALVWLLVGLGIGVAASLMLVLGYSILEHGRLSRRFRRARASAAAAAEPVPKPAPVAPKTSLLARPAAPAEVAARPAAAARPVTEVKPVVAPKATADDKPARPALVAVAAPERKPAKVAEPRPAIVALLPEPVAVPKRPQSVEAMFAQAFANDKLPSPEPDEAAGAAKPGAEKPPG